MPRPKADLMRESRQRKAERGDPKPWRPDLAPITRTKAERVAAERGISPAAAVDAMVAEAGE